jgi:hypothetical protein
MAKLIVEMSKAEVLLLSQSRVRHLRPTTTGCPFRWQYAHLRQKDGQIEAVRG